MGAGDSVLRSWASSSGATIEIHAVPSLFPEPEALGFESGLNSVEWILRNRSGLILVAGPRGSGRSSLVAFLIDRIASETGRHIYTIEDPVEFVHRSEQCLVTQREIGTHVPSFERALDDALHAGPDVVSLGPLRNEVVVMGALRLADAGARVLATVDSPPTTLHVRRHLLALFPPNRRDDIRQWIASQLVSVHCRLLLSDTTSSERVPAGETLFGTATGRRAFSSPSDDAFWKAFPSVELPSSYTLNQSLATLYYRKRITLSTALSASFDVDQLQEMINHGRGLPER